MSVRQRCAEEEKEITKKDCEKKDGNHGDGDLLTVLVPVGLVRVAVEVEHERRRRELVVALQPHE